MEVVERTKISDLTDDELVGLYVQIRDQISVEKKAWETRKAALDLKQDRIGGILLARFNAAGHESARTKSGTAYKHREYRASIADRDAVKQQLLDGAWELVTLMPNKAGIKQHIEASGDLPAGFNWTEEITIRVNRA